MAVKLPDLETAEKIALAGLAFLAAEPERLTRFMALTGIDVATLRADAAAPYMLSSVLDYLAGDESQLLVFTTNASVEPELIGPARHVLSAACRPSPD